MCYCALADLHCRHSSPVLLCQQSYCGQTLVEFGLRCLVGPKFSQCMGHINLGVLWSEFLLSVVPKFLVRSSEISLLSGVFGQKKNLIVKQFSKIRAATLCIQK